MPHYSQIPLKSVVKLTKAFFSDIFAFFQKIVDFFGPMNIYDIMNFFGHLWHYFWTAEPPPDDEPATPWDTRGCTSMTIIDNFYIVGISIVMLLTTLQLISLDTGWNNFFKITNTYVHKMLKKERTQDLENGTRWDNPKELSEGSGGGGGKGCRGRFPGRI